MNECMTCWEAILPHTVRHPTIARDLLAILGQYQSKCAGAMYSGCGGGYVYVVSETPVHCLGEFCSPYGVSDEPLAGEAARLSILRRRPDFMPPSLPQNKQLCR